MMQPKKEGFALGPGPQPSAALRSGEDNAKHQRLPGVPIFPRVPGNLTLKVHNLRRAAPFCTRAGDRALRPSGPLLTGWRCRGAAGLTVPSSWARAASFDCSPAEEGGRRRAPGTGRTRRRAAAAAAAPARGRAAAPRVPTHSPGAAAPGRRGARPPSSRGRDPLEDSGRLGEAAEERCPEAEPPPGATAVTRPLSRQARGGNDATAGEGAAVGGVQLKP